jgi:hypothetical protein
VNDINLVNSTGVLGDGRPIFSTAVSPSTRLDPRFNHIYAVQSNGSGHYNALSLTLNRRWAAGVTYNLSYTLGKGIDNAPINNAIPGGQGLSVNGDDPRSDPTNLDRDKGPNLLDIRHNFNGSIIYNPTVESPNRLLRAILNNNQIGVLLQFNSGLPFNIRANRDLNGDGQANNDRPLFIGRNSMYLPNRYNVDLRYSRFIPLWHSMRGEVVGEFKNIFNTNQTLSVATQNVAVVLPTDDAGNLLSPLPSNASGFTPTAGFEQREFQLGFRFRF